MGLSFKNEEDECCMAAKVLKNHFFVWIKLILERFETYSYRPRYSPCLGHWRRRNSAAKDVKEFRSTLRTKVYLLGSLKKSLIKCSAAEDILFVLTVWFSRFS